MNWKGENYKIRVFHWTNAWWWISEDAATTIGSAFYFILFFFDSTDKNEHNTQRFPWDQIRIIKKVSIHLIVLPY